MIRFRIKLTTTVALVALSCSGLANAKSFVAKCEKNNELNVRFSGSHCNLDWNKGGESNRCRIKNSIMKFATYDSGGQVELDLTSGEMRHGAKIYKCILSGDIRTSSSSSSSTSTQLAKKKGEEEAARRLAKKAAAKKAEKEAAKKKVTLYRITPYSKFVQSGLKWFTDGNTKFHVEYVGEVRNGRPHGFGELFFENESIFDGQFRDGRKHGEGVSTYANGDKYVGEFIDGLKNGQGTYTWGSGQNKGDKYVGEFVDGLKNGQGTYTWADGSKYVGRWKGDQPTEKEAAKKEAAKKEAAKKETAEKAHPSQLVEARAQGIETMISAQSELMRHPDYPDRSRVESALTLLMGSIAGDDLALIQSTQEKLLAEVALMVAYAEEGNPTTRETTLTVDQAQTASSTKPRKAEEAKQLSDAKGATALSDADKPQLQEFAGIYEGFYEDNEDGRWPVITRILDSNGNNAGSYSTPPNVVGQLDLIEVDKSNRLVKFRFDDEYGTGSVSMIFSANADSFEGKFDLDGVTWTWTGRNWDKSSVPDGTLHDNELKQNVAELKSTKSCPNCFLRGADLKNMNLSGANLRGADLMGADLTGADLSNAVLASSSMRGVVLTNALLKDTNLDGADLAGVDLSGVKNNSKSNSEKTCSTREHLNFISFNGANLDNANLNGLGIHHSKIESASFRGANLSGTCWSRTELGWVDFTGANLREAKMLRNIGQALNMTGADLTGADLLHGGPFDDATFCETKMPDGRIDNSDC